VVELLDDDEAPGLYVVSARSVRPASRMVTRSSSGMGAPSKLGVARRSWIA